jgi:hypothetical protein
MATNKSFFVKPAQEGLKVRDPITKQFLKPEGERKPKSSHWIRRLEAGEIVEVKEPAAKTDAPVKAAGFKNQKSGE